CFGKQLRSNAGLGALVPWCAFRRPPSSSRSGEGERDQSPPRSVQHLNPHRATFRPSATTSATGLDHQHAIIVDPVLGAISTHGQSIVSYRRVASGWVIDPC